MKFFFMKKKRCPRCATEKELTEFGSNRSTADGKNCYCRHCIRQMSAGRTWYHKVWRDRNRDYVNEKSREWVANNKEKRREIVRRWDQNNPEKVELKRARYRERKRAAAVAKYREKDILDRDGNRCKYCGKKAEGLDHVVPISRGGADCPENVVACCVVCNRSKGSKLLTEWSR